MNNNNISLEFKQLIVSDKDKQYGFAVNTVGFQTIKPNQTQLALYHVVQKNVY